MDFREVGSQHKSKRQEFSSKIRSNKREQAYKRNRRAFLQSELQEDSSEMVIQSQKKQRRVVIVDQTIRKEIEEFNNAEYNPDQLMDYIKLVFSENSYKMHKGIIAIRKILLGMENERLPLQKCIDLGMIPRLIQFLHFSKYPQLKYEATQSLALLTSANGEICKILYNKGALKAFVDLLKDPSPEIQQQAIWGIGNLAADRVTYRDKLIEIGAFNLIIKIVEETKNTIIINHGCWAITNLCRGFPHPAFGKIKESIRVLCAAINLGYVKEKGKIISDCYYTIGYLIESGQKDKIQYLLDNCNLAIFFRDIRSKNIKTSFSALRILGNLSQGSKSQLQFLIDYNFIGEVEYLLHHPEKQMRKQTCWVLSNLAGGSCQQISIFFNNKELIKHILYVFQNDCSAIRKECCWIFTNMCFLGDREQVLQLLIENQILRYFIPLMNKDEDNNVLDHVLCCLDKILDFGQQRKQNGVNILFRSFQMFGGVPLLEDLQTHQYDLVYEKSAKICQKFAQSQHKIQEEF